MADERIIVYGNDIGACIEEAKKECSRQWWKTADEIDEIDQFMADDNYKELDYLKIKAMDRYKDLMFDRLVSDIAISVLEIAGRVPVPNTIITEKDYREYKESIIRRIAKEILKEAKMEE
jgi:hypothetical protein